MWLQCARSGLAYSCALPMQSTCTASLDRVLIQAAALVQVVSGCSALVASADLCDRRSLRCTAMRCTPSLVHRPESEPANTGAATPQYLRAHCGVVGPVDCPSCDRVSELGMRATSRQRHAGQIGLGPPLVRGVTGVGWHRGCLHLHAAVSLQQTCHAQCAVYPQHLHCMVQLGRTERHESLDSLRQSEQLSIAVPSIQASCQSSCMRCQVKRTCTGRPPGSRSPHPGDWCQCTGSWAAHQGPSWWSR